VPKVLLATLFVLGAASACASQPVPPAKPPLVDAETQLTAPRRRDKANDPPPRIIAPPPAYGNKIVMAGEPETKL